MPLTGIQTRVLKAIAANRSPESYLAGATVLHRGSDTPRFSQDLDLFHDLAESVALCAETDAATLGDAGYDLSWLLRTPAFYRAVLSAEGQQLRIEWAQDSAFRFFPVQEDDQCGYCLHPTDAAVNKILALAGRQEIRDFVDTLHLHDTHLQLGALAWAACGKDPGFTPGFLLEQAGRHVAYTQADVDRLSLQAPLDLTSLKKRWLKALEDARRLVEALPPDEVGSLYLDAEQRPVTPDPASGDFSDLTRHHGSIRGAWPTVT
ncbi:MAG: nucleotidyl transferase AbiEii/AbiGii toxin family protein [Candidatus Latescibacteria bacterium]|jgi:hypothetical protein|nr:hypothetical protein [Gemmatimonadaceae bacterium]MDP7448632.1 nucleotidyl transferase AbiEii/AbiGii toxin family protein [Candidatus Latescibacterota bacterium]|tara:strand:- start:169 stop:957 length:789 start_codon:yes stop_codon:yes gene_type:complete